MRKPKVPVEALERPVTRPQRGLTKAEYQRELERSGFKRLLKICYPTRTAQCN